MNHKLSSLVLFAGGLVYRVYSYFTPRKRKRTRMEGLINREGHRFSTSDESRGIGRSPNE